MHRLTRRELMLAGITTGTAHFGGMGCSSPQRAIAEPPRPPIQDNGKYLPMIKTIAAADNTFGIKLIQEISKQQPDTNLFLSPLSLALALHMTLNGAKGATLGAMRKTLAIKDMNLDTLNSANGAMRVELVSSDPKVQLEIANGIWSNGVLPDFDKRIKTYYEAEAGSLAGAPDNVNAWVKAKTKGKIDQLLNSLPPNVVAILVNAAYFKGLWSSPFNKSRTANGTFLTTGKKSLSVPMMTQTGTFPYLRGKGFEAIRLPYGSGRLNFLILLPDAGKSPIDLLPTLTSPTALAGMSKQNGTISLPRFQLKYETELKSVLSALGMGIAFDPDKADFSAMSPDSWIAQVIHKTYLEVNEEGTEAAAASGVVMAATSAPISGFTMTVNRPFCCAIQDSQTGALLFLGTVFNPVA